MSLITNFSQKPSSDNIKKSKVIVKNNNKIYIDNDFNETIPELNTSKFNKKLNIYYKSSSDEDIEDREEISQVESPDTEEPDKFDDYIIAGSVQKYTSISNFLRFNWNGVHFLDKWELQRKVDIEHATKLARSMLKDYNETKEFLSYDPIHLGKKPNDNNIYVLDGQHRLEAYIYFNEKNKYPIQQIPAILWNAENEEHFIELFRKINSRLSIDKLKLVQMKLLEICEGLEKKYGTNIWGINRPKINKHIFTDKFKNSEFIHKLTTEEILNILYQINENIRGLSRPLRVKPNCAANIHLSAENIDFFLGLDKNMLWINQI